MYSPLSFMPVVSDPARVAPEEPEPVDSKLFDVVSEYMWAVIAGMLIALAAMFV